MTRGTPSRAVTDPNGGGGEDTGLVYDLEFISLLGAGGAAIAPSYSHGSSVTFEDFTGGGSLTVLVHTPGAHHLKFEFGGAAAHADNTASLTSISSTNADGIYVAGDTINITATFSENVVVETPGIVDGVGGFDKLLGARSVTTAAIDGRTYALVASFVDNGVQIIDITDPVRPNATASVTDGVGGFDKLLGAYSVTTAAIDGRTYALVASYTDSGVQIIDITDPARPNATASVTDGVGGFDKLRGAFSVTTAAIDGRTYALVASSDDNGVQIMNITDPARPDATASVTDGVGGFDKLLGARSVTTAAIDGRTYALVASYADNGVQIMDITDPARPNATASVTDGVDGFDELRGAISVTTAAIDGRTYALVASYIDSGVQIMDITDPARPGATASVTDGVGGFDELRGAISVTTAAIDGRTYALVASSDDSGVQIMDITDPARPGTTASVTDGVGGFDELRGAFSVTTAAIDGRTYALVASTDDSGVQMIDVSDPVSPESVYPRPYITLDVMQPDRRAVYVAGNGTATLTFEYVVQNADRSPDLAYTGTGALVVPPTSRIKDQDGGAGVTLELPAPGQPNSLSANKDIVIHAIPTANAGPDQTVNEGAAVTLDGSGSSDPHGDDLTYSWNQTSGPEVDLAGADTASPTFTAPTVASNTALEFTLTVSDGTDVDTDTVTIAIRNLNTLVSVSSTNADGTYVAGDTINITATFSENVAVETPGIVDEVGGFDELNGAASVTTAAIDGRTYALVASFVDAGVQIMNITDPARPDATASVTDGVDGFDELLGAVSVTTAAIDGRTYALVASSDDNGVQIMDITDPARPDATASVTDGVDGFDELLGAYSVTTAAIDGGTYALVASFVDDGVQIMDITDPARPNATASVTDGVGGFDELRGASSVTTAAIDGRTYALVASFVDDGVQIMNITDPARPDATASVTDGVGGFDELRGASSVTTAAIDGRTYALVASYTDSGVQIMDITDPARPNATASVTDGVGGFDELLGAYSVTTAAIDGRTYALVASSDDNGVQIIDITDPARPNATASVTDGVGGFDKLLGAYSVTTAAIDGRTYALVASFVDDGVQMIDVSDPVSPEPVYPRPYITLDVMQPDRRAVYVAGNGTATLTFEYVVQNGDRSPDLAYTGTGALVVPPTSGIKDQDGSAGVTLELPAPGQLNSLSANKDIVIHAIPTASAGPDQTVNEGAAVTLDGSGSSDPNGDPLAYSWSQTSGQQVTLAGADTASPTFTAPTVSEQINLVFQLTVTAAGESHTDTVSIAVRDSESNAPTADAGPDQTVNEGTAVTLDGSGSSDPNNDPLAYSWSQTSGTTVSLSSSTAQSPTFTAPVVASETDLVFELDVSDGADTVADTVTVTVRDSASNAPTADAGPDQTVDEGDAVTLDGSGSSDPNNDPLAYSWSQTSGQQVTLAGADTASPTFTAPTVSEQINLVFQLTVTAAGESHTDTVSIAVRDSESNAPTADAGPDQTVNEGTAVTLDGSGSSDPNNDPLAYSWSQTSGTTVSLSSSTAQSPTFTAPVVASETDLVFELDVSDGADTVADTVTVTVRDSASNAPTADAGPDQTVDEGDAVTLDGSGSSDPNNDPLAYSWTHDGDPAITITGSDSLSASFTAPNVAANTTITVTLTVNDGTVDVSDTLQVTITDSTNHPPVVGAGDDQEVVEGDTVSLSGTATDDDPEDAPTYSWTHDGALAITITGSDSLSASFTAPNVAANTTITVTLTVNDGTVDVSDTLQVTITDSTNHPPVVGAGDDQEVVEGDTVSLSGTATDDDPEDAPTYSWTHDGALAITITGSDSLSASFTAPNVAANTTVTVTLTVNDGTVDVSDTLQVTITDSTNHPPVVGAGDDQEVVEGDTVSLSGTATDDDPEDAPTYSWTHDGALAITITGSDSLSASFTAPNVAANTTVTVTLTVNDGTVDVSDTLQVTITDSTNHPPVVGAGDDQEVVEGDTVSLSGTATDDDPEDAPTYSWTHDGALAITIADPARCRPRSRRQTSRPTPPSPSP